MNIYIVCVCVSVLCVCESRVDVYKCMCLWDGGHTYKQLSLYCRKFADIGLTVQRQYRNPCHHLTLEWAHLVTVHAIAGPGTIQALKEVAPVGTGCVLVVEMSTKGALATGDYTKCWLMWVWALMAWC